MVFDVCSTESKYFHLNNILRLRLYSLFIFDQSVGIILRMIFLIWKKIIIVMNSVIMNFVQDILILNSSIWILAWFIEFSFYDECNAKIVFNEILKHESLVRDIIWLHEWKFVYLGFDVSEFTEYMTSNFDKKFHYLQI